MRVLGVDGCVGGWIVVELTDDRVSDCRFAASFAEIAADDAEAIGVDIPLGEPPEVRRAADPAARAFLSGGRPNSVFDAPPWATLTAETHADASRLARALTGRGLAAQSWALRAKILDATPHWRADAGRIHEVHPEVSFRALAAEVVTTSKKTWAGHRARVALLRGAGVEIPDDAGEAGARGAPDDVLDAAVVAWSAARLARGEAESLPAPPERDADGNPVAIWY